MKKLIVCLLALCLLLPAAWAEEFRYEGDGYATADEAAVAYANAFARGDVMGMLSTFAVESYVDHFDSEAYLSYIRIYRPTNAQAMLPLPYQEGYGRQLRILDRVSSLTNDFCRQYVAMCGVAGAANEPNVNGLMFSPNEPEVLTAFLDTAAQGVWPGNVTVGLVIGQAVTGNIQFGRHYSENMETVRAYAGCDETAAVGVMLMIDGASYIQVMQCIRYGDRWYNHVLSGVAGSYLMAVMPSDSGAYDVMCSGLLPADKVLSLLR